MKDTNKQNTISRNIAIKIQMLCGLCCIIMLFYIALSDLALFAFCLSGLVFSIIINKSSSKMARIKRGVETKYLEILGLIFGVAVCLGGYLNLTDGKSVLLGISIIISSVALSFLLTIKAK